MKCELCKKDMEEVHTMTFMGDLIHNGYMCHDCDIYLPPKRQQR